MHFYTMTHEEKTFKSCNPEILHHEICNTKSLHFESKNELKKKIPFQTHCKGCLHLHSPN
jgi:hypothetical protein